MLELQKFCFTIEINQKTNIMGPRMIEHMTKKFGDLSKVENIDAQIFYYT